MLEGLEGVSRCDRVADGGYSPDVCEGGGEVCCECPAKERRFAERRHIVKLVRGGKSLGAGRLLCVCGI